MRYMYTHVFTIQFKVVWIRFRVACYLKKREFLVFLSFLKKKNPTANCFKQDARKHQNISSVLPIQICIFTRVIPQIALQYNIYT